MGTFRYGKKNCTLSQVLLLKVFTAFCLFKFACGCEYEHMDEVGIVKECSSGSRRSLDGILEEYASRAIARSRTATGTIYDVTVPSNLSGIRLEAVKLERSRLYNRGIKYNEFEIPTGVLQVEEDPYVQSLVLVYENLGNWSGVYYNNQPRLQPGYELVGPVLGLLAYDGSNVSSMNLAEVDVVASKQPILIRFAEVIKRRSRGPNCCMSFYMNGSMSLTNVTSGGNVCSTNYPGHFALVAPQIEPPNKKKREHGLRMAYITVCGIIPILLVLVEFADAWYFGHGPFRLKEVRRIFVVLLVIFATYWAVLLNIIVRSYRCT